MKEDTEIKQEDLCHYIKMEEFKAHRDEALKIAPRLYEGDDFEPGDDPFYLLSKAYAEGKHGLQKDERKADEYLKKSADACVMSARREVALRVAPRLSEDENFGEYTDPYYSLAQAYLYGKYDLEKNIEKGLEYLKNSADSRFTDACYDYSRVLAAGILCKADLEKAADYAFAGTGYDSYLGGTDGLCEELGIACVRTIDNRKYEFFVNYWDGIVIRKLPGTHEYVMKRYYDVVNNGVTIKAGVESPLNTHAFKLPTQYGGHCFPISEELYNCFGTNWIALPFEEYGNAIGGKSASDMWDKFAEEVWEKDGAVLGEFSEGVKFYIKEVSPQSLHVRMSEVQHTDDAFFAYLRVAESAKDDINPNLSDADRVKSYMAVARCYLVGLHGLAPASEDEGSWLDARSWLQDAADLGCAEAKEELKKFVSPLTEREKTEIRRLVNAFNFSRYDAKDEFDFWDRFDAPERALSDAIYELYQVIGNDWEFYQEQVHIASAWSYVFYSMSYLPVYDHSSSRDKDLEQLSDKIVDLDSMHLYSAEELAELQLKAIKAQAYYHHAQGIEDVYKAKMKMVAETERKNKNVSTRQQLMNNQVLFYKLLAQDIASMGNLIGEDDMNEVKVAADSIDANIIPDDKALTEMPENDFRSHLSNMIMANCQVISVFTNGIKLASPLTEREKTEIRRLINVFGYSIYDAEDESDNIDRFQVPDRALSEARRELEAVIGNDWTFYQDQVHIASAWGRVFYSTSYLPVYDHSLSRDKDLEQLSDKIVDLDSMHLYSAEELAGLQLKAIKAQAYYHHVQGIEDVYKAKMKMIAETESKNKNVSTRQQLMNNQVLFYKLLAQDIASMGNLIVEDDLNEVKVAADSIDANIISDDKALTEMPENDFRSRLSNMIMANCKVISVFTYGLYYRLYK